MRLPAGYAIAKLPLVCHERCTD